ncbi:MAG: aspartate/glutamate racemase family protein [Calditrichales bacterium]|nr:aspartate/glutamate racemase family protein [Calditrichales bacterium]
MRRIRSKLILKAIFVFSIVITSTIQGKANDLNEKMASFFAKEKVTILITDSGLGGLSVAAEIEKGFHHSHPFSEVELVFVNALASKEYVYNQMENTAEKVRVFNNALYGMTEQFSPDLILIACNTLTVIFDQTEFSKKEVTPVIGIVEFGVGLMNENLKKFPDERVIIIGTPTTISQNTHKSMLMERGITANRITTQSCSMLESEIQNDPAGDMAATMIEMYADEALAKIKSLENSKLSVGLCCTHYAYSAPVFKEVFSNICGKEVKILNPNLVMSAYIFENSDNTRFKTTAIAVRVVSQAELFSAGINAIAGMLKPVSPAFAHALKNYVWMKTLFRF